MELREWLNRGYGIYKRLIVKKAHMESIGNVISNYELKETEGSSFENSSEINVIRWSELKKEVDELKIKLFKIDKETEEVISLLKNPDEYAVLYCRYVSRLSWADMVLALKFSKDYLYKLHRDGVNNLDATTCYKVWDDET